jgi:hypothetical protein
LHCRLLIHFFKQETKWCGAVAQAVEVRANGSDVGHRAASSPLICVGDSFKNVCIGSFSLMTLLNRTPPDFRGSRGTAALGDFRTHGLTDGLTEGLTLTARPFSSFPGFSGYFTIREVYFRCHSGPRLFNLWFPHIGGEAEGPQSCEFEIIYRSIARHEVH